MKRLLLLVVLGLAVAGIVASTAGALSFADQPCPPDSGGQLHVCPAGAVGTPYSVHLEALANSGNGPPYTFYLQGGAMPPGLTLRSDGLISGTPIQEGSFTFGVQLQDNPGGCAGCGCINRTPPTCAWRQFRIDIVGPLDLEPASVPPATINVPYSAQLTATPSGTQTWTVDAGVLPPGLSIDPSSGLISGTPTTGGSYHFAVLVKESIRSARREYTIDVAAAVTISVPTLNRSEVSVPFSATLTAAGGTGNYTWTVSAGALPPGLTLGTDGSITGTPTTAGSYGFTITATDQVGRTASQPLTIKVAAKLAVSTVLVKPGKVGKLYKWTLRSTGGVLPKRWKLSNGVLPRGIRLDRQLGVLSGMPRQPGRYRFTVQITDALGVTSQKSFVLVVAPKPKKS